MPSDAKSDIIQAGEVAFIARFPHEHLGEFTHNNHIHKPRASAETKNSQGM